MSKELGAESHEGAENARRYIEEIAWPTVREFEQEQTSVRRAFLACAATFHAMERLYPKGHENRRKQLRSECGAFAVVDRVTHAFKHINAGHQADPSNRPITDRMIAQRPPAFWGVGFWNYSKYGDLQGRVVVTDDPQNDLVSVVKCAFSFLEAKAAHTKSTESKDLLAPSATLRPKRDRTPEPLGPGGGGYDPDMMRGRGGRGRRR